MRVAMVLWILGLFAGTAAADAVPDPSPEQVLLDVVASQDVAAFGRLAPESFELDNLWFHDPDCARQFSGVVEVTACVASRPWGCAASREPGRESIWSTSRA